jgi:hypothetical protein
VNLGNVRTRILIMGGAWLIGAGTATGGCLMGVSLLGQGLLGPGSQQLTVAAVNRALASEAAEPSTQAAAAPSPHTARRTPMASPSPSQQRPAPVTSTAAAATPGTSTSSNPGTLLTSRGGQVVAACNGSGAAYLMSWSPNQGFEATHVVRGPADTATVTFQSVESGVTMQVTCNGANVPTAAVSRAQGTGGGDN